MRCLALDECRQWRSEHCRRHEWKRQTTWITPRKRLPWYSAVLVEQLQPFDHALLVVDQVIFNVPPALDALRRAAGEQRGVHEAPGHAFESDCESFQTAFAAVLSGFADVRALFSPSRHALREDHDEYTTLFSESSGKIADVRRVLSEGGVQFVEYTAKAP